ncbi:uncharacterized protein BN767_00487 [Acidiphilium sp. CAG:727]|nr:uncharacterized protein BN767_00487 [Acidiphilium sp. CAG:727]
MKNAKRNVIVSAILTIALCFSLMIGGTYAWFTDSAKISVNKIVSGTLKVGLNMWDEENEQWVDANGKTLSFIRTDAEDEDNGLWAPGYKFKLPKLQVVNKGNLKLKYKLEFNGMSDSLLLDVLTFRVKVDGGEEKAVSVGGAILENEILAANEDKEVEIFGEMNENAKNEYQNLEVKNMSITLTAAQTNATEYPVDSISSSSGSTIVTESVYGNGRWGAVQAERNAQITVEADVKAVEKDHGAVAVWASGNSKVIINGGYFSQEITGTDDQYDMIYADDNAVIEINGGKFKCKTPKWTLNCKDGSNAKIIVKGGRFYNFNPLTDNPGEVEVAKGYHVEKSGYWYIVYSNDHVGAGYGKAVIGEGEDDWTIAKIVKSAYIKDEAKLNNNVVLVGADYANIPLNFAFGKNVIIDCNGHKLTYKDGTPVMSKDGLTVFNNGAVTVATTVEEVQNAIKNVAADGKLYLKLTEGVTIDEVLAVAGGDVTIDANGKMVTNTVNLWNEDNGAWSLVSARNGATVTVKGDGTFKAKDGDSFVFDVCDGSTLVIDGGKFIGNLSVLYVYEGTAIIKGGFFDIQQKEDGADPYRCLLNLYNKSGAEGKANIVIYGGTFVNYDPSKGDDNLGGNFVADGYKVVSTRQTNGDVWYTVVKA